MEKRRNTLDRLQRFGFGRRSSPSPTDSDKLKKSSDKSERLKELTELLKKGNTATIPPAPPAPVPPPRLKRHESPILWKGDYDRLDELPVSMKRAESERQMVFEPPIPPPPPPPPPPPLPPPINIKKQSKGSRGIPFRSSSFTQVDIKSTLNAIRDRFRRDKSVEKSNSNSESDSPIKSTQSHWDLIKIGLRGGFNSSNNNLDRPQLEDFVHTPDIILEEDDKIEEQFITETDSTLNLPTTIAEAESDTGLDIPRIATEMEIRMPMESPPETILQTATTCSIPVPVDTAEEWISKNPQEEWVDVEDNEVGLLPEVSEPLTLESVLTTVPLELREYELSSHSEEPTSPDEVFVTVQENLPTISVSTSSNPHSPNNSVSENNENVEHSRDDSLDYFEVKKR